MIVRLICAVVRDLRNLISTVVVGPQCRVTHEHVPPWGRVDHERYEHPTDGPCVLL